MSIIPDFVLSLVTAHLTPLLHWFSDYVYADLLKRTPDHLLVKLHKRLNLAPVETACAAFHHTEGPGTKPTHTVPHMVRALLVGYLQDWSLRELEWQIRFNLVVKWWVGYPVFAAGPDHTTLERFELWVCFHQPRTLFDQILRQIDHDFPQERQQAQIGDSYALRANAAKESLVRLLRHTCQRLLAALAEADPAREAQVRAQLDLSALWGAKDELGEYHLKPEERAARLQTTVLAAQTCARRVRASLEQPVPLAPKVCASVRQWLVYLDKLIADEVHLSADDTGQVTQVTERAADDKGSYRLGSATDPDATYRVHGDDKKDFGYNPWEIPGATSTWPSPTTLSARFRPTPALNLTPSPSQTCCGSNSNTTTSCRTSSSMMPPPGRARRATWSPRPWADRLNWYRPCSRMKNARTALPQTAFNSRTRARCSPAPTVKPPPSPIVRAAATGASFVSWDSSVAIVLCGRSAARRNPAPKRCAKSLSAITAPRWTLRALTIRPRRSRRI
jgi:hypothetical protein